ncbi:hypothetical protein SUGI_1034190 [Cryptomeria japonica]|nr:hypothetical protein SUGI_1034190 [Cryptomeria japonica]
MKTKCESRRSSERTSRVSSGDRDEAEDKDGDGGDYFLLPVTLDASVFLLAVLVSCSEMVLGFVGCIWSEVETSVWWDVIVL